MKTKNVEKNRESIKNTLRSEEEKFENSGFGLWVRLLLLLSLPGLLSGCPQSGVQGGDIPKEFHGINQVEVMSPTAIKLYWDLDKKFTKYHIYKDSANTAIQDETFGSTIVSSLYPDTSYSFSVTGVFPDEKEEGLGLFQNGTTLPSFTPITAASIKLTGPTTVRIDWKKESDEISYLVYVKKDTEDWNFEKVNYTATAVNYALIENLAEGTYYCFYVVASYKDGTSEPQKTSAAATAAGACLTTSSDLQGLPSILVNSSTPGLLPWFESVGGQESMSVDIFDKATNTRVATRKGPGSFRSFLSVAPGFREFYGLISQTVNGVVKRAKVDLTIKDSSGAPLTGVFVRSPSSTTKVEPRLVSGGKGIQNLGVQMVEGDFNCDGIPDLAISAPTSTPYVHPNHISEMGSVIVYYGEKYTPDGTTSQYVRLRTSETPSITAKAPFPQLIYYPVDYSSYHFGTKMVVGNFNGDCKKDDPLNSSGSYMGSCEDLYAAYGNNTDTDRLDNLQLIHKCDDLAIAVDPGSSADGASANSQGGVFVIYGNAREGLVSGAGSNNFGLNEGTCDPVSSTCRAVRMNHDNPNVFHFGRSLGVGDLNNDGFDDLIVGETYKSGAPTSYYGRVTVLRGSSRGVLQSNSSYAFADIIGDASFTAYSPAAVGMNTLSEGLSPSTSNFAWAVGAARNSRACINITAAPIPFRMGGVSPGTTAVAPGKGYDLTKCDDLVIGDPSRGPAGSAVSRRGSIVTCKANFAPSGDILNQRKITSWICAEHYPGGLEAGARYGFSIISTPDQNGYPLMSLPDGTNPDIFGALFVGAPYASVPDSTTATASGVQAGKVFGYYMTPGKKGTGLGAGVGGIQDILGSGAHTIPAFMDVPCNRKSDNVGGNQCNHQVLYDSSSQAQEHFGYSLGLAYEHKMEPLQLPMLLVGVPDRKVPDSRGLLISGGGAVYAFKGDLSTLGTNTSPRIDDPITGCAGSNCYYFSGGVSPFGPSLFYFSETSPQAAMGVSSAVGENFYGSLSNGDVDLITSAPNSQTPVESNGGVYIYQADSGFPANRGSPDISITTNLSKELNYRFEEAKVVGDLNGDGYEDVVSRIKVGTTRSEVVIYYGSSEGLKTSVEPSLYPSGFNPKIISTSTDPLLGNLFFPLGDINGDGFDDVLFVGGVASYIYYGSTTGVVSNSEPSISPVGKNPIKFAINAGVSTNVLFHGGSLHGNSTATLPNYDVSMQALAHGDFNGDGYEDFAVGVNTSDVLPATVDVSGLNGSTSSTRKGRVFVIYGGPNGPQIGANGTIRIQANPTSTAVADVVAKDPCQPDPNQPSLQICSVQMLGSINVSGSSFFGWSLGTIASMETTTKADGLMISDPGANGNDGEAYYFKGSMNGIDALVSDVQTLSPPNVGGKNQFGYQVIGARDINGDGKDDVVITAPAVTSQPNRASGFFVFYGSNAAGVGRFFGTTTMTTPPIVANARHTSVSNPRPQYIIPSNLVDNSAVRFAYGVSAIGDFNRDGFSDIIVNVSRGDYELDILKPSVGYYIIFFGSSTGLMSDYLYSVNPKCYGGSGQSGLCEPYQFFIPDGLEYENTYLSNSASGDINGDGYMDIVIGGLGRNHSSGLAFSSGVFYVLF